MDGESLYRQLGHLIESAPKFDAGHPLGSDHLKWIGRAYALLSSEPKLALLFAEFQVASRRLETFDRFAAYNAILMTLYKALAIAEMLAPPGVRGAFIPAGNSFDAFAALSKLLSKADSDVFVVDPYMDATALTDFFGSVSEMVPIRLLADESSVKPSLAPAVAAWTKQYPARNLSVRLAPPRTLHDRAIFLDRTEGWILTQSLKDFAKRSPAEIVRADETAALKIAAYEAIWENAAIIARKAEPK